jgi:hypothetical protein
LCIIILRIGILSSEKNSSRKHLDYGIRAIMDIQEIKKLKILKNGENKLNKALTNKLFLKND